MQNQDIARIFYEIADILEILDENRFRINSYRNAALAIEGLNEDINSIYQKGALRQIAGIGRSISQKIEELIKTGRCAFHQEMLKEVPRGVVQMMRVPGVGPKHAMLVYKKLGVNNINRLRRAAEAGKLAGLPRMGEKLEKKILKGIGQFMVNEGKFKLVTAYSYAEAIKKELAKSKVISRIEFAGSLRRKKDLVGDLDILAISDYPKKAIGAFLKIDGIKDVLAKGRTKSSILLNCGLQVDLRVLDEGSFGVALYYFTGSKAHNVAIRDMAKRKGIKINEYGIFKAGKRIAGSKEEDIFKALGLMYIQPELRENLGEIETAAANRLPQLLEEADLFGDFHMHTKESDGKDTIEDMAQKAIKMGYKYIAITEHSKAVRIARGRDEKELSGHFKKIDKINSRLKNFRVLKGVEVDIMADGSLDLKNDFLKECDVVIAAIHSRFQMPKEKMTQRIINALQNKNVDILAHPTGRLLNEREPYAVDIKEALRAGRDFGVAMELSAYPDRLDLNDAHCKLARDMGVKIALGTDSHSAKQLDNMRWGVYTARRGWLKKQDVLNTLTADEVLKLFKA